jgi:glycosyltransferase involved in cell wall biosynthesis
MISTPQTASADPRANRGASGSVVEVPTGSAPAPPAYPRVSVILATYNERANLEPLISAIGRLGLPDVEFVVVDDGSTDGTREFLRDRQAHDARMKVLLHNGRQTLTKAQCEGIQRATGGYVVVMDADLQHPPEVIPELLRALDRGATLAVASRYLPGGSTGDRTAYRGLLSRGAEAVAKVVVPETRRIRDPLSGFFAFRRDVFVPLTPGVRGYKLLLFVLVMARRGPVVEVPYHFGSRSFGVSKITEGFGFVRIFLTETILVRRLAQTLARTGDLLRRTGQALNPTTALDLAGARGQRAAGHDSDSSPPAGP